MNGETDQPYLLSVGEWVIVVNIVMNCRMLVRIVFSACGFCHFVATNHAIWTSSCGACAESQNSRPTLPL